MKIKELLEILPKDLKIAISYVYNVGFDTKDEIPKKVLNLKVKRVTRGRKYYDFIIYPVLDAFGEKVNLCYFDEARRILKDGK